MDFNLPEELQMLKENLRRFVDTELIPIERETNDGIDFLPGVREKLEDRARALGLWLFDVPEEFGGLGLGALAKSVMWEEIGRTIAIPARNASIFGPRVSPILYALNDGQKEDYLFPVIKGEKVACFCQTEPDAGGDVDEAVDIGQVHVLNEVGEEEGLVDGFAPFLRNRPRGQLLRPVAVVCPAPIAVL